MQENKPTLGQIPPPPREKNRQMGEKLEENMKRDSQYFVMFSDSLEVEVEARPFKKIGCICFDLSEMLEFSLWQDLGLRA